MGQPIGLGNFIFRDLVKYILPTVIALTLFAPLLGRQFDLETLVFASILLGYFFSPMAAQIYERMPFVKKKFSPIEEGLAVEASRWNLDRVFYSLNQDEKNAFYLTDAYRSFYLVTSAYFFAYFVTLCLIMLWDAGAILLADISLRQKIDLLFESFIEDEVPVLLWDFPILVVAVVTILLAFQALSDSTTEMKVLFGRMYGEFARKFQLEGKSVAKAVWGKVDGWSGHPEKKHRIAIIRKKDGQLLSESSITTDGRFLFTDAFQACVGTDVAFRLDATMLPFRVTATAVPEFTIRLTPPASSKTTTH
jgi:hypothetical protein